MAPGGVPVGVYVVGRERLKAFVVDKERRDKLGDSQTTLIALDPCLDEVFGLVSKGNTHAVIMRALPKVELMHQFLLERHTRNELRQAVSDLFDQSEYYAEDCLGRMAEHNGQKPNGLPDELNPFFA